MFIPFWWSSFDILMSRLLSVNFTVSLFSAVCLSRGVFVLPGNFVLNKANIWTSLSTGRLFYKLVNCWVLFKHERKEHSAGNMESWFPDLSINHTSDLEVVTHLTLQGLGFFTWEQGSKQLLLPKVFFLFNLIFFPYVCPILSVVLSIV